MNNPLRLLIAEHDLEFAIRLRDAINELQDVKVIEIVRDGQGAVDSSMLSRPDLVVMNLRLPVLDSINAIQSIIHYDDDIKILTLSSIPEDRYAIEAIKAGASGCVEKNGETDFEAILEAIQQIAKGDVLLNPALASSILEEFHRFDEKQHIDETNLTP